MAALSLPPKHTHLNPTEKRAYLAILRLRNLLVGHLRVRARVEAREEADALEVVLELVFGVGV